ncbi:hypothetical protein STENM327S_01360 [Streptomyces tendae]
MAFLEIVGYLAEALRVGGGDRVGDDPDRAGLVGADLDDLVVEASGDGGGDDECGLVPDLLGSASALSPSSEKSMVGICCSSIAWRTGSTTLSSSW